MYLRYITEHSNQLHQLLVSVSRHFYVLKNGMLHYQEKPIEVNIGNYQRTKKEHLVYYILRDHFSGSFVFEVATTNSLVPLADFLYYGWSKGEEEKYIWGMPDAVYIPQRISSPGLFEGLIKLGVEPLNPPSGFASGIRIVRDLEEHINYILRDIVDHRPENIKMLKKTIYEYLLHPNYEDGKFKKWKDNLPSNHPKEAPGYQEFIQCFNVSDKTGPGLVLVSPLSGAEAVGLTRRAPASVNGAVCIKDHKFSAEKLNRAEDLVYDAWEAGSREKRLNLARQALKISPYCADAYVLLAEESRNLQEALRLYEQGVMAGRLALGDLFFKRYAGEFWSILETRPYMRALAGLAGCLWKTGQRREAISYNKEMLRLNPDDHQGIRYVLANRLLEEGMDEDLGKLLAENEDDPSCCMLYNRALWSFRTSGGGNEKSELYLKEAVESNAHVSPYLLGKKNVPYRLPAYWSLGGEEEAILYAQAAKKAWQDTPGALEWLARCLQKRPFPAEL
ncbi:MAG: hypothetical protein AB1510_12435 [Bacillota bacterium]